MSEGARVRARECVCARTKPPSLLLNERRPPRPPTTTSATVRYTPKRWRRLSPSPSLPTCAPQATATTSAAAPPAAAAGLAASRPRAGCRRRLRHLRSSYIRRCTEQDVFLPTFRTARFLQRGDERALRILVAENSAQLRDIWVGIPSAAHALVERVHARPSVRPGMRACTSVGQAAL